MRNKAKNTRMKLEVTLSGCGKSFLYEIFINFTQQKEKILRERKIQLTESTYSQLSVGFKIVSENLVKSQTWLRSKI